MNLRIIPPGLPDKLNLLSTLSKNRKHKWLDSIVYSRLDKSVGGLKFKSVIRGLLGLLTKSTGVIEVFSCRKTSIYSQNGLPFVHFRLKDCIT